MMRKPEINIGLVGHVDHGKTTLAKALSGKWADTHSEEMKRGISIKLGYADSSFYKCPFCKGVEAYGTSKKCGVCGGDTEFLRSVSFVDSPGHETLMATMLSGAALMDGALLVIAANEPSPQPQTEEHLMGLDIIGVKNIVIVQNKIDTVREEEVAENYASICKFVKGGVAANAPIIPISAQHNVNVDAVIRAIEQKIPTPKRERELPALLYVARSFDVNKPGSKPEALVGGVIGGALVQGTLKVNDELELKPGMNEEPIRTRITSLVSGGRKIKEATPGGLVGIGTSLDPSLTKSDRLTGKAAGKPDTLPPIWSELVVEIHLLERVVGAAEKLMVKPIRTKEILMLSVGVATTVGAVTSVRDGKIKLKLKLPICATQGQRAAISRRIGGRFRLIGYGIIR